MSAENDHELEALQEAPGATLAAARTAEKLSVAEVARHLKLSVAQVEALEAGEFDRLPGPVFVRGFVRNYARLLKLDPEALLRQVEPELSPQPVSPEAPPSKDIPFPPRAPRRWPYLAVLGAFVVAVLALYEFYWTEPIPAPVGLTAPTQMPEPAAPEPAAAPAGPVAVDTGLPAAMPESAGTGPGAKAAAERLAAEPGQKAPAPSAKLPPAGAPDSKPPVAPAAPAPKPAAAAAAAPAAGVLKLSFTDESWVEIRDRSGNVILSQLNPAGTEKRVQGDAPLSLVIGNAHGVRLTYNDRPVDLQPHTKVDVARFVLE